MTTTVCSVSTTQRRRTITTHKRRGCAGVTAGRNQYWTIHFFLCVCPPVIFDDPFANHKLVMTALNDFICSTSHQNFSIGSRNTVIQYILSSTNSRFLFTTVCTTNLSLFIQYISIYIQAERVRQKILSFFFWGGAAWSYAPAPKKQKPSHSISGSYNLQKKGEKNRAEVVLS